jgi:hypothetical protein
LQTGVFRNFSERLSMASNKNVRATSCLFQ